MLNRDKIMQKAGNHPRSAAEGASFAKLKKTEHAETAAARFRQKHFAAAS
jgi:hypothetical protein